MMTDRSDTLSRIAQQIPVPQPAYDRMMRRRDLRRRHQRIGAGIVGAAVFLASMWVWTAIDFADHAVEPAGTGPTTEGTRPEAVGFVGLPPEGSVASTPEEGDLVLFLGGGPPLTWRRVWVYADGRVIWHSYEDVPEGANARATGFLEQRLTPDGVDALRDEIMASGLFDGDLALITLDGRMCRCSSEIDVRLGDRVVRVSWADRKYWDLDGEPGGAVAPDARVATTAQADALDGLKALLEQHPGEWLPSTMWSDQRIGAYVASSYQVCFGVPAKRLLPSDVLSFLPGSAAAMLEGKQTPFAGGLGEMDPPDVPAEDQAETECYTLTTEDARGLDEALSQAGFEGGNAYSYGYEIDPALRLGLGFAPMLPHGGWACTSCG
jgi:hypothetical protein